MYQSSRILQLVCPIYRAPHSHLHDKKGLLRLVTEQYGTILIWFFGFDRYFVHIIAKIVPFLLESNLAEPADLFIHFPSQQIPLRCDI